MKAILFGLVALLASSAAIAADADAPAPYPPAPPPAPIGYYNWAGSYFGINVGHGWAEAIVSASQGRVSASASEPLPGIVGGVQSGSNFQTGNFVYGLEVDVQGTSQQHETRLFGRTVTDSIPLFSTVRARAGVALDRVLLYGTGGGGWAQFLTQAGSANSSEIRGLWTVGAGIEVALSGNWSAKAEYLYLHSLTKTRDIGFGIRVEDYGTDQIVRFGINYKLGAPPIAAQY
jgi:outer membrane immunogenic protein